MTFNAISSQDINENGHFAKEVVNKFRFFGLLMAAVALPLHIQGQSTQLLPKRELGIAGVSASWTALNYYAQFKSKPGAGRSFMFALTDKNRYKPFDKNRVLASDLCLITTGLLSAAALYSKEKRYQNLIPFVITAESVWITANITHSSKMAVRRNRPYTFAPGFNFSKRDDVYSFFSGHSSVAAALVTSAVLLHQTNTKSAKGKNVLLYLGTATACTTGYIRIKSGKHYPSDVISGLLTGMGIAFINYKIHEK